MFPGLRKMIGLSLALAAWPAVAHADGLQRFHVCGGNNFTTCASVSISVVGQTVTMEVVNLSGGPGSNANAIIAGIGFLNLPPGVNVDESSLGSSSGTWYLGNDQMVVVPSDAVLQGDGVAVGSPTTFTFTITGHWDPSDAAIALRSVDAVTGQVSECRSDGGAAQCVTVTPEPLSMGLLATGLAGMGGAGLIRRRRRLTD